MSAAGITRKAGVAIAGVVAAALVVGGTGGWAAANVATQASLSGEQPELGCFDPATTGLILIAVGETCAAGTTPISWLATQAEDGKDGTTGVAGRVGKTGAAVLRGENGRDGIRGAAGAVGTQGAKGETGPTGAKGDAGAYLSVQSSLGAEPGAGNAWIMIAAPGPVGLQGTVGPQGPVGPLGINGSTGPQGLVGIAGPAGSTGLSGSQGIKGEPGVQGEPDVQGMAGPTGAEGDTGPAGPAGLAGAQGIAGDSTLSSKFGVRVLPEVAAGNARECFLGEVVLTAGLVGQGIPAFGQLLSISQNSALFSTMGTTYGGDGVTTFGIPDLRAVAPNGLAYTICDGGTYPSRR